MEFDAPVMMAHIGLGAGMESVESLLAVALILAGLVWRPVRETLRRWRSWRESGGGVNFRRRYPRPDRERRDHGGR